MDMRLELYSQPRACARPKKMHRSGQKHQQRYQGLLELALHPALSAEHGSAAAAAAARQGQAKQSHVNMVFACGTD